MPFLFHFLENLYQKLELFSEFLARCAPYRRQLRVYFARLSTQGLRFGLDVARRPHSAELDVGFLDVFAEPVGNGLDLNLFLLVVHKRN